MGMSNKLSAIQQIYSFSALLPVMAKKPTSLWCWKQKYCI